MSIVPPTWLYTWGRPLRALGAPFDWLLRYAGTPIVVLGEEHLDALPDRVILAGTHRSFADTPLVRYALAHSKSRRLVAKLIAANAAAPSVARPFVWVGVLVLGLHPIDQHLGREVSLRALARTARATGSSILIFPQGTHSTTEAELAGDPTVRFRSGVAHLAEALDLPVVPFGLAGPEHVIPPVPETSHGLRVAGIPVSIHRAPLAIAFGAPLWLDPDETAQAFAARLQDICAALTRRAERAVQNDPPRDAPSRAPWRHVAIMAIKLVHSLIFLVNSAAIMHIFVAGLRNRPSGRTRAALAVALTEVAVFVVNRRRCPLTDLVERLGAENGRVSDIFLPRWLADRIPQLCGPPLLVGVLALAWHRWIAARIARRRSPERGPLAWGASVTLGR